VETLTNDEVIELVRLSVQGDRNAFKKLYDQYNRQIYTLAMRMTTDHLLSQDILQDIFLRVWQKLHTFKFESSFFSWLYRLSLNVIMRKTKSNSKHTTGNNEVDVEELLSSQKFESSDSINGAIDLERALLKLPEQPRKIFILYVMEGFSHKEIKEIAGISEGASKAHLSRARAVLRKELQYET